MSVVIFYGMLSKIYADMRITIQMLAEQSVSYDIMPVIRITVQLFYLILLLEN